jgi:glycosyltransferase involved in cell wall biosynthesis
MNELRLSIITITKDDPAGLARTLASSTGWRSIPGLEQIVVYHGTEPAVADPMIQVRLQTSQGIAGAFNEGLARARGQWIWFLNGGDEVDPNLSPDWLLKLLATSRANVLVGGITYAGEFGVRPHPPVARRWPPVEPWIPHPAALVRRDLFARIGRFDGRYAIAMDYEWWLRALPGDVRVDVLSVPFSLFADGGISQRPEGRSQLVREKNNIVRRYAFRLWKDWLLAGGRLLGESLRAVYSGRLGRNE